MAENDTLLAYLSPWFTYQSENIAVEALGYILKKSTASLEGLDDVVRTGVKNVEPVAKILTQVSFQNGTRPDLVGFDENNVGRVFIEAKFWAELTPRQPNAYLDQLPKDGPAVLLFVAPEERIGRLWAQLRDRAFKEGKNLTGVDSERKCVRVGETERHLMVVSWTGLLDRLSARAREAEEQSIEADIQQLRGLAEFADEGKVQPVPESGEEIGSDSRRMRDLKRLIDAATERGVSEGWISKKGLNRSPRSYGYGRYLRVNGNIAWFGVNVERWERDGSTPLWLSPYRTNDTTLADIKEHMQLEVDGKWVPIYLKRDADFPDLLSDVVSRFRDIAEVIQSSHGSA